jgi:hypothetical protein
MASQSPSGSSQSSFLIVDKKHDKEMDNLQYLAPASILTPSPSPLLMPVDSNWMTPSEYPVHSSSTHMKAQFTRVAYPNSQESVTNVPPIRGVVMPDCYSATAMEQEVMMETTFLEDSMSKKTPDLSDWHCSPPFQFEDVSEDVDISNKDMPFSHFTEKPQIPNVKLESPAICEDICWVGCTFDPLYDSRLCFTQFLEPQDVKEMDPLFITTVEPIAPPFLVAPVLNPPLAAGKITANPFLRSDFPETTPLQAKKRLIETNVSQSPRKLTKMAPHVMPVKVELLQHNAPVWLVKSEFEESSVIDPDEIRLLPFTPSRLEPPQVATTKVPLSRPSTSSVPKSKVDIDVDEEGNLFATIRLIAPSPSTTSKNVNCKNKRTSNHFGHSGKNPSSRLSTKKVTRPKKEDPFSVKSLVAKFIEAAKNKKIS